MVATVGRMVETVTTGFAVYLIIIFQVLALTIMVLALTVMQKKFSLNVDKDF